MDKKSDLYEQFLKYSYYDLTKLFKSAQTKEEQDFYITLSEIVLQKKQQEVIGKR